MIRFNCFRSMADSDEVRARGRRHMMPLVFLAVAFLACTAVRTEASSATTPASRTMQCLRASVVGQPTGDTESPLGRNVGDGLAAYLLEKSLTGASRSEMRPVIRLSGISEPKAAALWLYAKTAGSTAPGNEISASTDEDYKILQRLLEKTKKKTFRAYHGYAGPSKALKLAGISEPKGSLAAWNAIKRSRSDVHLADWIYNSPILLTADTEDSDGR